MKEGILHAKKWHDALSPALRKALLVDTDNDMNALFYYSAVLQHEGYDVRSFASYREDPQSFDMEDFDLIVVSQGSEAVEGCYVLPKSINRSHEIPVLVLTRSRDVDRYWEVAGMSAALDDRAEPVAISELA